MTHPATASEYPYRATVEVKTLFYRDDGVTLTDPPVVKLRVTKPDGVETVYTYGVDALITKPSAGDYRALIQGTLQGPWMYGWEGSGGSYPSADEWYFMVTRTGVP